MVTLFCRFWILYMCCLHNTQSPCADIKEEECQKFKWNRRQHRLGLGVKNNFESYIHKLKDVAIKNPENMQEKVNTKKVKGDNKKLFAYSVNILDLGTKLYIPLETSMKSAISMTEIK